MEIFQYFKTIMAYHAYQLNIWFGERRDGIGAVFVEMTEKTVWYRLHMAI